MKSHRATAAAVVIAELSHVFCCGLPIVVAVMSTGSQIGMGGAFLAFHALVHDYEKAILAASGAMLGVGFLLHYVSFHLDCRATECSQSDCAPQRFRVGWIFIIAVALYAGNLAFYFISGHGSVPPPFE